MADEIVFLFGAGASKGAGYVLPCCPPLNAELFGRLAHSYPQEWGPETPYWQCKEEFRQNFEETYSRVVLRIPQDDTSPRTTLDTLSILQHQVPLALYFSQFTLDPSGRDLYSKLLEFLCKSGLIKRSFFASLNYDCLFEQAASRRGLEVDYFDGKTMDNGIRIAKVHGSCNFITEQLSQHERALLASPGVGYEKKLTYLPPEDVERTLNEKVSGPAPDFLPVMTQISLGKEQHLATMKIQQIRNKWCERVSSASNLIILIIIGVSPRENDHHIWNPIQTTPATRILYIGGNRDFQKWRNANSRFEFIGETFQGGFEALVSHLRNGRLS